MGANREAGEIEVTLAGKTYTLRPSYRAVMAFEEAAGCSLFKALDDVQRDKHLPLRRMACMFHACIDAAWKPSLGKAPSLDDVAKAIHADGIASHMADFAAALTNALTSESDLKAPLKDENQGKE